ncbi:glutamyl-tRNA synthetase [mine drainage metagenome]|uniref:glutamate--tRNA ligase n=2 Tax=mine drainage metagenome TaxID=410659 RepID=T0ZTS9_9ZZZZ
MRTRFAPSPTGYLHVGGARTALFNWLFARHHGGAFILRIEDTDVARSSVAFNQAIVSGLAWLGLNPDEGPTLQSSRFERYRALAEHLVEEGHAYRCYCTPEELAERREIRVKRKEKPRYDGHCRVGASPRPGVTPVIRFRTPQTGRVAFTDLIRGPITFDNQELDDLVILRSDGTPTYNFGVVVDDVDMAITHVIRGDDHINNTPRQIHIFAALAALLPKFAHVPMILGSDGTRLSKRHGAVSVEQYREEGFLPEALVNYLVRLGWSHGDQEIFTLEEMVRFFDLETVQRAPATFDREKLTWINQHYLKTLAPERIRTALEPHLETVQVQKWTAPPLDCLIPLLSGRSRTLGEMADLARPFYVAPESFDEEAWRRYLNPGQAPLLHLIRDRLMKVDPWAREALHGVLNEIAETRMLKLGQIAQPIRVALMGGSVSPPIDETMAVLGRSETLRRIDRVLNRMGDSSRDFVTLA